AGHRPEEPARDRLGMHPLPRIADLRQLLPLLPRHLAHEPLPFADDQPVLTRARPDATSSSSSGVQGFTRTAAHPALRASSSILDCAFAVSITMGMAAVASDSLSRRVISIPSMSGNARSRTIRS